jgi:predicted enzyme related to lactoylglutathione lyase
MHVVTNYPDGVFSWVDLTTTDAEAAKTFYSELFNWEAEDLPTGMGGVYTMFRIDGKNVAGMGAMSPEMQAQGIPPYWTSYVKHDDVDAVAQKAPEAGGTVMVEPFDVMEEGRMAIIQDPTDAVFGVWQPHNHTGAQLINTVNALSWNELQTRDVDAAQAFYGDVFGWTYEADPSGYVTVLQAEGRQAGMMQLDERMADVPPNWSIYFMVDDAEATAAKAEELGGRVLVPPSPAGDVGTFSVLQDPQGAVFSVIRFDNPTSPPSSA